MGLDDLEDWELAAYGGDFSRIPNPSRWHQSAGFSHLIDGYKEAGGLHKLARFANERWHEAESTGGWQGGPRELWLCLFFVHRCVRHRGDEPLGSELELSNSLCEALRISLQSLTKDEARAFSMQLNSYSE